MFIIFNILQMGGSVLWPARLQVWVVVLWKSPQSYALVTVLFVGPPDKT